MEWHPARWLVCLPPLFSLEPQSPEQDFFFWHRLTRVVPEKGRKTVVCTFVKSCTTNSRACNIHRHVSGNTTSLPAAFGVGDDDEGLSCIIAAAAADCCCCCACIMSCCLAFLPLSRPAPPARSFMLLETALTATCRQIQAINGRERVATTTCGRMK